jgi:hypothetical protein
MERLARAARADGDRSRMDQRMVSPLSLLRWSLEKLIPFDCSVKGKHRGGLTVKLESQ